MEDETVWGPRYDRLAFHEIASESDAPRLDRPFSNVTNEIFKRSTNTFDGANRARELREKLFWNTPSIFTNPVKPVYSTHAPLLESIIRTGPYVPGYTTAMRTPSEMARLERETHMLRGNLLDRIRECPYNECQRYFPFRDSEGLARHITEDHSTLKCFLCDEESALFPYYDQNSLRRHFIKTHGKDILDALNGGGSTGPDNQGPRPAGPKPVGPEPLSPEPLSPEPVSPEPVEPETPAIPPKPVGPEPISPESIGPRPTTTQTPQNPYIRSLWNRPGTHHQDSSPTNTEPSPEEPVVGETRSQIPEPASPSTEATSQTQIPPRRAPSPAWDVLLEKTSSVPYSFQPDPDWRCSRCFRAAGNSMPEAEVSLFITKMHFFFSIMNT